MVVLSKLNAKTSHTTHNTNSDDDWNRMKRNVSIDMCICWKLGDEWCKRTRLGLDSTSYRLKPLLSRSIDVNAQHRRISEWRLRQRKRSKLQRNIDGKYNRRERDDYFFRIAKDLFWRNLRYLNNAITSQRVLYNILILYTHNEPQCISKGAFFSLVYWKMYWSWGIA